MLVTIHRASRDGCPPCDGARNFVDDKWLVAGTVRGESNARYSVETFNGDVVAFSFSYVWFKTAGENSLGRNLP